MRPYTSSPMDRPRAFSPSPRTTPDTSCEGMTAVRSRPSRVVHDSSQVSSANVMPAACTSTRASPGPGTGTGACSNTSCSAPPRACARRAIIVVGTVTAIPLPLDRDPGSGPRSETLAIAGLQQLREPRAGPGVERIAVPVDNPPFAVLAAENGGDPARATLAATLFTAE